MTSTITIREDWRSWRPLKPSRTYCRTATAPPATAPDELPRGEILLGDALTVLRGLPASSVDCVITSPPYYLLRNYDASGQLGMESSVDGWVDSIVAVCDELARVLKPTGSLWLNLGDSYSRHARYGAPPKGLLLAPERVLMRLADRGWTVRNKLVWSKPNPMPASVRDRLTCSWEPIYFLVRSPHYFFDLDSIRLPHTSIRQPTVATKAAKYGGKAPAWAGPLAGSNDGLLRAQAEGRSGHRLGKNPGDVWTVATAGYRGAHFATFPVRLITRPIAAACPERVCATCGQPWRREHQRPTAACRCGPGWRPGVVLDPFMGAGTVAIAAEQAGRDWLGIELNPDYRDLAIKRITSARSGAPRATTTRKEVTPHPKGARP